MMWETERYDWSSLRAMGSASHVPRSITRLQNAKTADEASSIYWTIDNVVVVQGQLYEAAYPTVRGLVTAIPGATEVARPYMLELIAQIVTGEASDEEISIGNSEIKGKCLAAIMPGAAMFFFLIQYGTSEEQSWCADILGSLGKHNDVLRTDVIWYFRRAIHSQANSSTADLISNWLKVLEYSPGGSHA